ncbi:nose resistant to fluoxetine protein 6-like [Anopheles bellator]|uniref:nose resistant to fluoxetine protein 6-like n=1 Tax=Anopheles bellator TaxID=139047 RepID=UPI0026476671|nr:nose resistant to fluoxetine protein 6-like [Anopheles bellator]
MVRWIVGLLSCWSVAQAQLSTNRYRPPDLFMYDNFEQCQARSSSSVYCYARTILRVDQFPAGFVVPNTESTDRIIFNHRRQFLELGVCIADCQDEVGALSEKERSALYQPKIPVNFTSLLPNTLFPTMPADKRRYETLVNICINRRLRAKYNISGYTALEFCRPPRNTPPDQFSLLELLFITTTVTLMGAVLVATLRDLRQGSEGDGGIVAAFSVRHNWNRLVADPTSGLYRELVHIDGLRVIVNHLVILLHSVLAASVAPSRNFADLEQVLQRYPALMYLSSNAFLVQIFFTIGGYLLAVNFLRDAAKQPIDSCYVRGKLLNRLLRLLPVYGYFLLFSVSLNVRFDTNMNGFRLFTVENAVCRQNWWANVLFINNFPWPKELCLMHSWYLAADLQLFLLALGVLLLIHRWPRAVGFLFTVGTVLSLWIPAYITHRNKLHPVLPIKLSEAKFIVMYEPWIRQIYLPSYANTGSYLAGLIAGYLHHRVVHHKLQLQEYPLYRVIERFITPLLAAVVLLTGVWYSIDVPKPSLWVSLYSTLYRNVMGVFVAVCFLRSINTPKGHFRRILGSKLFTTLGKLTYSVYVLHDVVMRFLLLHEHPNTYISLPKFLRSVYLVNGASFVGGLLVFLVIEQPMIQLLKPAIDRMCTRRPPQKQL